LEESKENKLWGGCFEERVTDVFERILRQFWQIAATLKSSSLSQISSHITFIILTDFLLFILRQLSIKNSY
ncbi:hypothetical protein PanWU01x14_107160, partial [Parasponia andersonii]